MPRYTLKVGDFAKLRFVPDVWRPGLPSGERMWVRVTRVHGKNEYTGKLDNVPAVLSGIRLGQSLHFVGSQVLAVIRHKAVGKKARAS
jgi:hypothetical protein